MAKEQKRSTKEAKKPKAAKPAVEPKTSLFTKGSLIPVSMPKQKK